MEIPDGAVWAAAIGTAGVVAAAVRISWAYVVRQFDAKDARVASLEDALVKTEQACGARVSAAQTELVRAERDCAIEKIKFVRELTQVYVTKVDEGAEFSRSLLQANNAHLSEFAGAVDRLAEQIRARGHGETT